jgi:hypothetical protein
VLQTRADAQFICCGKDQQLCSQRTKVPNIPIQIHAQQAMPKP